MTQPAAPPSLAFVMEILPTIKYWLLIMYLSSPSGILEGETLGVFGSERVCEIVAEELTSSGNTAEALGFANRLDRPEFRCKETDELPF